MKFTLSFRKAPADTQLELFPMAPISVPKEASIEERFIAFHYANPHVYRNLKRLAAQLKAAGYTRASMKLLVEKLRWEYAIRTRHDEGAYVLNNDYTSRYARLLMREPGFEGMFETRGLRDGNERLAG